MFRSQAFLLQIGAKNVCRRRNLGGVYQLARACFASDKPIKANKRRSDGGDVRKREERGSMSKKTEGPSSNKTGNTQAVKDILRDILVRVVDLKQTIGGLGDLPPVWAQEQDYQDSRRDDTFHSLKAIMFDFEHQVRIGVIKANGKHRHECSVLLEELFRLLSLCGALSDELSPFDECRRLIDLMENEWKIEMQHNHCEYVVITACREQRWSEASDVFWRHIDPNRGGYNPCDISITEPIGLYAIARDAQNKKLPVVDRVFDAVLRMSMVSPSDQDRYVIGAGTAIGLVGEWQAAVDFLNKASNAGKFGQPLVAAGMKACILCEQYDHAVRLYNELIDANHVANEWQWSGGEDRLHPLCRDLALNALGRSTQTGMSEKALAILDTILEDGAKISTHAFHGTLLACEKDGNWRAAVRIALLPFRFHERSLIASDDEELLSTSGETGPSSETLDGSLHLLLLPVIRVCTSQGFPGAAVLSQVLFATCYDFDIKYESSLDAQYRGCIDSLVRLLSVPCSSKEELLTASMVSLCGIDSFAEACMIFEETNSGLVATGAEEVYDWARSQKNKVVSDEWQILFERVRRVAAISLRASRGQLKFLAEEDLRLLSDATATCMRCSIMMSEPGVGLVLSQWLESVLSGSSDHSLPLTDSYLAASIAIANATGNDALSHQLIESKLLDFLTRGETSWTLSCNQALRFFLAKGERRKAVELFQNIPHICRNPETFEIVATGLANDKEWSGVTELYGQALRSGCNSEHLSIIAMKAVADGPDSGNVRLLRNIVDEIASLMRKKPSEWLQSNYWILKENLGFPLLRRLMRWNDMSTAHLKELALFIAMFELRVSEGVVAEPTTLYSIVHGALDASQEDMKIPGVPQDAKQWNDLIVRISREAERTDVCSDSAFVSDISLAFWKLGNQTKFADCINGALLKGIPIRSDVVELVRSTDEISSGE